MMSQLYYERTDKLFDLTQNKNCQGYYSDPLELFNKMKTDLKYNSYGDIQKAYNSIYTGTNGYLLGFKLEEQNHNLQLESCPLIY